MPWFGEIFVPWLTDKDTSIDRDTVEKNFVDSPSDVYDLTPSLEAGTYNIILNEKVHEKNESFSEQKDAVLSMPSRHGTEFPFQSASDQGYVVVENASVTTFPSLETREGEIELRYLDKNTFSPAVKVNPVKFDKDEFGTDVEPVETLFALPSSISVSNLTANYTVTSLEGDVDLYVIDSKTVAEYSEDTFDKSTSQNQSICRLFDSGNNRIYSGSPVVDNGSELDNSLIRSTYNGTESVVEFYDGSNWISIGSTQLPFNEGYAQENENKEVSVRFRNDNESTIYRGISAVEYKFSGETDFTFDATNSVTEQSLNSFYGHWQDDSTGEDIILVRTSSDGSFFTNSGTFGVNSLTSTKEYTVYLGVVPSSVSVSDYVRYIYNIGNRTNTFVQ